MLTEDYASAVEIKNYAEEQIRKAKSLEPTAFNILWTNWAMIAAPLAFCFLFGHVPVLEYIAQLMFFVAVALALYGVYRAYMGVAKPMGGFETIFGSVSVLANNKVTTSGIGAFSLLFGPEFYGMSGLLFSILKLGLYVEIPFYMMGYPPLFLIIIKKQYSNLIKKCNKEMDYYVKTNDPSVQEYMEDKDYYTTSSSKAEPVESSYPTVTDLFNKINVVTKTASSAVVGVKEKYMPNQAQISEPKKLFCSQCGAKRGEGKFCGSCGAKLV